jgi:cytochrome bd-type quinol oxidase subunit 2
VNVRTIIVHRSDIKGLARRLKINKAIHIGLVTIIPISIYGFIIFGHYTNLDDQDKTVTDNLFPLFLFMALSRILLLILFIGSALLLLRSLKSYSLKIYRFSKYKILLTLVLGSISLGLETLNFSLLAAENAFEEHYLHAWKISSLQDDRVDYSIFIFIYVLMIEFLPMISL